MGSPPTGCSHFEASQPVISVAISPSRLEVLPHPRRSRADGRPKRKRRLCPPSCPLPLLVVAVDSGDTALDLRGRCSPSPSPSPQSAVDHPSASAWRRDRTRCYILPCHVGEPLYYTTVSIPGLPSPVARLDACWLCRLQGRPGGRHRRAAHRAVGSHGGQW